MSEKKKCLIIDGNNLAYRSYYASRKLEWESDQKETYIFLKIFVSVMKKNKYEKVFVAFDEGKENFRKKILANYKSKRKEVPKEILKSIEKIQKILEMMKIKQEKIESFEADDLIASFVNKFESKKDFEFHIFSQDKDLFQLISENVKILRYKSKTLERFGKEEFFLENGFSNDRFSYYLALKGDEVDSIKGIAGIGKKRANKIVSTFKNVKETFSNLDLLDPNTRLIIRKEEKKIRENNRVTSLMKKLSLESWEKYDFSWEDLAKNKDFVNFCKEKKMKSILNGTQSRTWTDKENNSVRS